MDLFKKVSEGAKNLGEGISEGAKTIGKKSSELVGVAKLKYELSKLEKEMENNMAALGKLTYLRQKGETVSQEEIDRLLASSRDLEQDIDELTRQIDTLAPKPVHCAKCQAELPAGANYCYSCGEKIVKFD